MRTGPALAAAVLAVVCAACGDDPVDVRSNSAVQADYNRDELTTAIARFVEAGRTPQAYGALAAEVAALRPGMDATVAELAELQMVVLALGPIEAARPRPLPEQTALLATTVWPVALGPAIEELAPDGWRPAREGETALRPGESADAYVRRLCDGAYAVECRHVVPEWQGAVLGAEAISRMAQRTRAAVANCEECGDAAWREAVGRWELLDRAAITERRRYEERGATSRWPVAGAAAAPWPAGTRHVEIEPDGDWLLDGALLQPRRRAEVLGELRGGAAVLGVHLPPGTRVETLEDVAALAASAGYAELALAAREPVYPWGLRAYRIPATRAGRLGRAANTLQVYLRSLDGKVSGGATGAARRR